MRILISSHGASLFGAERVALAIARGLRDRGHHVTLELPHEGPALEVASQLAGVAVAVTGRARLPRNAAELVRWTATLPKSTRTIEETIRGGNYDVVWVNSIYNPAAASAGRNARVPAVWHLHERNLRWIRLMLAGWIGAHADLVVVPSAFVAESYASAGMARRQIRVVQNALLEPIEATPLPRRADRFVVGYVGQLEPRKRATDVLEAVAQVDHAEVLVIGDGKARGAVEAARARLNLGGRARLAGFQPDVRPLIAECDCIVIPSRNEPFGLVALEAMAAGRPVIAADSGALPEVLGDAALYYPLADTSKLAGALRRLRAAPELAEQLRTRGLERVKRFSIEMLIDGVEAVAQETVARRRWAGPAQVHT